MEGDGEVFRQETGKATAEEGAPPVAPHAEVEGGRPEEGAEQFGADVAAGEEGAVREGGDCH